VKRMTDDEFEAKCNAAHVGEPNEVLRWKGMAGVAIREAERARAREARLEAALVSIRDLGRALSDDWIIQRATDALGDGE
jgi:hypothetical protein